MKNKTYLRKIIVALMLLCLLQQAAFAGGGGGKGETPRRGCPAVTKKVRVFLRFIQLYRCSPLQGASAPFSFSNLGSFQGTKDPYYRYAWMLSMSSSWPGMDPDCQSFTNFTNISTGYYYDYTMPQNGSTITIKVNFTEAYNYYDYACINGSLSGWGRRRFYGEVAVSQNTTQTEVWLTATGF